LNRPIIWLAVGLLSLPPISLAACTANGSPTMQGVEDFFSGSTPVETPTPAPPAPTPTASPSITAVPTPVAGQTTKHPRKKTARQTRGASQNAAAASKNAVDASAAAAQASKDAANASRQAASVATQVDGSGSTTNDVSLEANPATAAGTAAATGREGGVPASTPSVRDSGEAAAAVVGTTTPTLSSPAMDSSGSSGDAGPPKAAKLIEDVDGTERRVDRKNLSADDSQRDILAQKLIQEAKKSLAEHDSAAAISLATKAATLLAPLPKLADSAAPSAP
jgi:hypothetical protein